MSPNAPKMGSRLSTGGAEGLFGKTRLAVLTLFFTHPDREFYLRQITKVVKTGQGAVHRELIRLAASGILIRTKKGGQVFYQVNQLCPFFAELKTLLIKTSGVADVLRQALAQVADKIKIAFIYGSIARNSEQAQSDVDLAVIGDISFGEVVSALAQAQDTLTREINPVVYSEREFRGEKAHNHFTIILKDTEKIFLIGSTDEFEGLVK